VAFAPILRPIARGLIVCIALLLATGRAGAEDPLQWWNAFSGVLKTGPGQIETRAETRYFEGGDINLWSAEAFYMLEAGRHFSWGPGLKYQEARALGSHFLSEDRYLMAGRAGGGRPEGWRWILRGIVEYRDFEDQVTSWRYRLRPEARHSLRSTRWEFSVFDEVYYDSIRDTVGQNRFQLGLQRPLSDHAALTVHYLLRSDRVLGHWEETQVFGTTWSFR
jgi:hypothetical protein